MRQEGAASTVAERIIGTAAVIATFIMPVAACTGGTLPSAGGLPGAGASTGGASAASAPAAASSFAPGSQPPDRASEPAPATAVPMGTPAGPTTTPIEIRPPASDSGPPPGIRLSGAFGSVDGEPASPGGASLDTALPALDTYVSSAPLSITLVDPDLTFAAWSITATPAASPGPGPVLDVRPYPESRPELLRVTGPPAGDWLLRADVTATGRAGSGYAWRLTVPDRQPPADGHLTIPTPRALVRVRNLTLRTVPGSGCYVEQCTDAGRTPPAAVGPQIHSSHGEALRISLDDGSHFVRWDVSAQHVYQPPAGAMTLERGGNPAGVGHVDVSAPPGSGDWMVTVALTFDRRRGSYLYFFRLTIA
jgi:hypothetical protein